MRHAQYIMCAWRSCVNMSPGSCWRMRLDSCDMQNSCLTHALLTFWCARRGLTWTFDLAGIGEMYASYEATSLWPFLRRPVAGARVSFVRAEGSNYRWAGGDEQRITALGHDVHLLRQAGAPHLNP